MPLQMKGLKGYAHLICPMAVFCPVPTTTALARPAVTTVPCMRSDKLQALLLSMHAADNVQIEMNRLIPHAQRVRDLVGCLLQTGGRSCPGRQP